MYFDFFSKFRNGGCKIYAQIFLLFAYIIILFISMSLVYHIKDGAVTFNRKQEFYALQFATASLRSLLYFQQQLHISSGRAMFNLKQFSKNFGRIQISITKQNTLTLYDSFMARNSGTKIYTRYHKDFCISMWLLLFTIVFIFDKKIPKKN